MIGSLRHTHQRAKPQALPTELDLTIGRAGDRINVDDKLGPHDVELHQIEQRDAAGEIFGAMFVAVGPARSEMRRVARARRTLIYERAHGYSVLAVCMLGFACFTASTILG